MAAVMDSPNVPYPESPMDQEDVVYPCKGCGEILEEGKAFELAGNRWHIDCFRCNTCGTLLDSDANLLLLGDGSLICNNCTYSCSACGNKIEDLAILTGDQAFCSGCFKCRNCKRKIDNLRYARTSQGIFCMSCHESLMSRRRKKSRGTPKPTASSHSEKALPSLPPGAVQPNAFTPDIETPPETNSESQTPQPRSPKDNIKPAAPRNGGPTANLSHRDVSPLADDRHKEGGQILPASTYNEGTPGNVSSDDDDGQERGFLPMAFDPTPIAAPPAPGPIPRKQVPRSVEPSPPSVQKENLAPRDYLGGNSRLSTRPPPRDVLREGARPSSSRSASTEREGERVSAQAKASPHILYQEKGRTRIGTTSDASTPLAGSKSGSPVIAPAQDRNPARPKPQTLVTDAVTPAHQEAFKLQEVPRSKRRSSRASGSPAVVSPIEGPRQEDRSGSPVSLDSQHSGVNPFDDPKRKEVAPSATAPLPSRHADRSLPLRGDSLGATARSQPTPRQESPSPAAPLTSAQTPTQTHGRHASTSSVPSSFVDSHSALSQDTSRSQASALAAKRSSLEAIPPRSASRPGAAGKPSANDGFITSRAPPPHLLHERQKAHESISTLQSDRSGQASPGVLGSAGLPKYSSDGIFSMEDEMGRILRGEKRDKTAHDTTPSVLRRVSNAVKHGRSFSDRDVHKPIKTPASSSVEIISPQTGAGSPLITSPATSDGAEQVRISLRRAQQHIAELQADKLALQEKLTGTSDMRAMNSELNMKRNTMTELDREREMVMRELTIMTDHLTKAKDNDQPFDPGALKSAVVKDFGDALEQLKASLRSQIENLMRQRNDLTEEIGNLIQMKDKGFQEYESLSSKNAQLLQHNNELLRSIQGMYQDNRAPSQTSGGANGLGIYQHAARGEMAGIPERNQSLVHTESSMSNLLETEAQPATVLDGPQMVNIRKGMKPTKFNWRKGGEKMAGKVTKGIKGAFAGVERPNGKDDGTYSIGMPYSATQQHSMSGSEQGSLASKRDVDGKGFGFFGQKAGGLRTGNGLGHMKNSSSNNLVASDGSTIFGSELVTRCEYENRLIPMIVTRCIQEVESRGMEVEGVYRKSGGAGQVKAVQQGFEKEPDFDISDPDLDIHAVTSALKQYFRKLPTPLIVYDVYDAFLEAGQLPDKEQQVAALRMAVEQLPDAHHDTLAFLIHHLARVMAHEPQNLMTPLNLAVVFAPTIMRSLSIEREMSDMQVQRAAVQALLEQHKAVFALDE